MPDLHCNYLITRLGADDPDTSITFRLGDPTDWETAIERHAGIDGELSKGELVQVRYGDRWYRVLFSEVRCVDQHGGGLGSARHRSRRYVRDVALPTAWPDPQGRRVVTV